MHTFTQLLANPASPPAINDVEPLRLLATIAKRTSNAAVATDTEGRIVWVNESFTRITGYTLEEVLGKVPGHFLQCSETCPETVANIRAALSRVEGFNGVILNKSKDGHKYWLELDIQPNFNEQGIHIGFVAIETDVTETKRLHAELDESTRFLKESLDSTPSQIAILDESGTILFVNRQWKQFAEQNGFQSKNFGIGGNYLAFAQSHVHPAASPIAQIAIGIRSVTKRERECFEYEHPHEGPRGTEWFLTTVKRFECNGNLRLLVSHQDVSELKQTQTQLHALNRVLTEDLWARTLTEEKLRTTAAYLDIYRKIVDHHAIVAETDTSGTIVSVNDAFCKLSGYSREELIGNNHRILNSGLHPKSMWSEMYKTVANGGFWHGEICNRNKAGNLYWVDTTIAPLFSDTGRVRGYFAIRADITSLKVAQAEAESANRSKSEFLANMSHEIRTPMTAILGYADILAEAQENGHLSVPTIECVNIIKRNGEHLLSIINDILDISKIEAEKMTTEKIEVSPVQIVIDVFELMKVKAQAKGLYLKTNFHKSVPETIQTDPTRLRQILVNLVGNAIKFTEIGGVSVEIRMDETNKELICFDVIDTGIGLNLEQVERLFLPFEQADTSMTRKFGGTGLGLQISKRLAEILGGGISVSCAVGGGCSFTASVATGDLTGVPRSARVSPVGSQTCIDSHVKTVPMVGNAGSIRPTLAGMRILIAEDGPDNQRLFSSLLRKAGAAVEVVDNGRMAVEKLSADNVFSGPIASPPPIDLILMDMQMPVMDGYEATKVLRNKGCAIPILALTAHAMDTDRAKCLEAGCNLRLTKPIDKVTLIDACAHWGAKTAAAQELTLHV